MVTFALVDCNNFYASCERLFRPHLKTRPVVVLSNNDGCVIARSQEAKSIGIAMGAPLFKIRNLVEEHGVEVCSSNYALYGDISERVMTTLGSNAPNHEVYSIDECFLDVDNLAVPNLTEWCKNLRHSTYQWTGIPVSIGVGPTKTLAKLANRLAKKSIKAAGVIDLSNHPAWIEPALRKTPIGDVWGVGRRWSQMLEERGIMTAHDFAHGEDGWIRKKMGVVGLRTVHELRGYVCHALEDQPQPKQTTCCTRSFGETVTEKAQVHDALMSFAERAAEKVRAADQVAGVVQVFIRTDPFNLSAAQKSLSGSVTFDHPTSDTRAITGAVTSILDRIWRDGFAWKKAGVMMLDLTATGAAPPSLFDAVAPKNDGLMNAMDALNQRYGRGSIRLGLAGKDQEWRMRRENLSPSYTTKWADLAKVVMG
ncbi:DNA repair nucleotidyltransferase [Novosphingobium sp. AAP83]|uniref:Y-family DNA polymerase n=1 Tax=Novosphingobium sp. AAP83 TaxID=1523425 RepID=UPI0006B929A2|nr:Y-family DNA polymerase [Novosphingobium sp. AAP83]KPF91900.1 DNA repair nucleotidyltransferase [Novosphingobium sp. AAP83]